MTDDQPPGRRRQTQSNSQVERLPWGHDPVRAWRRPRRATQSALPTQGNPTSSDNAIILQQGEQTDDSPLLHSVTSDVLHDDESFEPVTRNRESQLPASQSHPRINQLESRLAEENSSIHEAEVLSDTKSLDIVDESSSVGKEGEGEMSVGVSSFAEKNEESDQGQVLSETAEEAEEEGHPDGEDNEISQFASVQGRSDDTTEVDRVDQSQQRDRAPLHKESDHVLQATQSYDQLHESFDFMSYVERVTSNKHIWKLYSVMIIIDKDESDKLFELVTDAVGLYDHIEGLSFHVQRLSDISEEYISLIEKTKPHAIIFFRLNHKSSEKFLSRLSACALPRRCIRIIHSPKPIDLDRDESTYIVSNALECPEDICRVLGMTTMYAKIYAPWWKVDYRSSFHENSTNYEYPPTTNQILEWGKILPRLLQQINVPCQIDARIYGTTHSASAPTVVIYVPEVNRHQIDAEAITVAISPWKVFVLDYHTPFACGYSSDRIGASQQSVGIYAGASIGGTLIAGSGSFGGYLVVNNEVVGTTAGHCIANTKVEYGFDEDRPVVCSVSNADYEGVKKERTKQLQWADEDLAMVTTKKLDFLIPDHQEMKERAKQLLDDWSNITTQSRYAGVVRACSGNSQLIKPTHSTTDWAIFQVVQHRRRANSFPAFNTVSSPLGSQYPKHIASPRPVVWDDGLLDKYQKICFRGCTSGYSEGFVRGLKIGSVCYPNGEKCTSTYWSISVTRNERGGDEGVRNGDSGAWCWELISGRPVGHIVTGVADCAGMLELELVFKEIEEYTGHKAYLAIADANGIAQITVPEGSNE